MLKCSENAFRQSTLISVHNLQLLDSRALEMHFKFKICLKNEETIACIISELKQLILQNRLHSNSGTRNIFVLYF